MRNFFMAALLALTTLVSFASQYPDPARQYPRFSIGVTGIHATIEPGLVVTVAATDAGTPCDGKLKGGDKIVAINGKPISGPDPRVILGNALTAAESSDRRLTLSVIRDNNRLEVPLTLPVLGAYAPAWPASCKKSEAIIRSTAEYLARIQHSDGGYKFKKDADRDNVWSCLAGLFLLSTGDPKYLPNVQLQTREVSKSAKARPTGSAWHLGYQGILLAEYYLKTGDESVLPGLKSLCDEAVRTQAAGSWGHGGIPNPGYVQSGLMNSAAVPVFTTLILAQECGVAVDEEAFNRSARFFYRMAGHGSVCYGDHRAEIYVNTGGRNGMLAVAFSLLDHKPFKRAAEHLAMLDADSYFAHEAGHTGGGFNMIWRALSTVHVPAEKQSHYRAHMDNLAWYLDLCRVPGGGFNMPPSPPNETTYCGLEWGSGAVGLSYTAPLKTLRITGAPKSKFSKPVKVPSPEWGHAADLEFFRIDGAQGFDAESKNPREIFELVHGKQSTATVSFYAKMLRHYNPSIRTFAAHRLGKQGDESAIKEIALAIEHADPRVRRAAFDAISGYESWNRPMGGSKILPAIVSAKFLERISKTLNDKSAAFWEVDGALWALGCAEPAHIREHLPLLREFAKHDEWYLREAAVWAISGLRKTATADDLRFIAEVYANERHVFARSSYDAVFRRLIKNDKVTLTPAEESGIVKVLGKTFHSAPIAQGYGVGGQHEAAHRTMMILSQFNSAAMHAALQDLEKYLETWTPNYQHSAWMITGSNWQPGLAKVARQLGKEAVPLIRGLKNCLQRLDQASKDRAQVECREALLKLIREIE